MFKLCQAVGWEYYVLHRELGATTTDRPKMFLNAEGCCGASPAMDYLGPGQNSVNQTKESSEVGIDTLAILTATYGDGY